MITSVNEMFSRLGLKADTFSRSREWVQDSGVVSLKASLTLEDDFLEGVVTELNGDSGHDVVFFVFDMSEREPLLTEGTLHDQPCTSDRALMEEFVRQVNLMGVGP